MTDTNHENTHSHHSDTVQVPLFGTVTVYGGIYTVIFGVLGVLTAIEVIVAELFKNAEGDATNAFRIIALFGIGILKAIIVVWFYMHLRTDNKFFRLVLLFPVFLVVIAIVYLLGVPVGAGGGYN